MVGNVTIGQYYPVDSVIHRLDARVKLLGVIYLLVLMFNLHTGAGYIAMIVFVGVVIKLTKVPFKLMLKGLKPLMFLIVFTSILNILFTPGQTVWFELGFVTITKEAVFTAVKTVVRLIVLIIISSILTLTTSPIELTDGIEYLLKPFKKIGVPSHEIAMMMTIALRFIPTLIEEMDKIMKAQMARGSSFDTGNIVQRAKSLVPLLVPLFISSFRRADELAMAMEARCYRGDINRTRMKVLKMRKSDVIAVVVLLVSTGLVVVIDKVGSM